MTEWGVVTVLIALVGLTAALTKPIVSLTQSITKLTVVVDKIVADQTEQVAHAKESHARLWDHNEEQDNKISDHEIRITKLEG